MTQEIVAFVPKDPGIWGQATMPGYKQRLVPEPSSPTPSPSRRNPSVKGKGLPGQVNILNAFGRPPSSATVTTGSGSVDVTDMWRDEGTVSTVNSDQGIPGTVRIKVDTVHPCAFLQTAVNEMHIRVRLSSTATGNANVRLKNDNGTYDLVGTVPLTSSLSLNELYLTSGIQVSNVQDYIDASGNINVRIEVPGPLQNEYQASIDQVLVRCLRTSETE